MWKRVVIMAACLGLVASPGFTKPQTSLPVGVIKDNDYKLLSGGCYSQYWPAHTRSEADFFIENTGDDHAIGILRLPDRVVRMVLKSASGDEKTLTRHYADPRHIATLDIKARVVKQNPDSDSVEMKGTITLTLNGKTFKIPVEGATLC